MNEPDFAGNNGAQDSSSPAPGRQATARSGSSISVGQRDPLWIKIPIRLLDHPGVAQRHILVYAALASFANFQDLKARPGVRTLQNRARLSRPTVIRAIRELDGMGWLKVERRKGRVSHYQLFHAPLVKTGYQTGKNEIPPLVKTGYTNETHPNESQEREKIPPTPYRVLADLLATLTQVEDSKFNPPETQRESWARSIRLLVERDGRPLAEVEQVLRWAKRPGEFWFPNIMSGGSSTPRCGPR